MREKSRLGQSDQAFSLLFVCLGNICRSPAAEGVMQALVKRAGMDRSIQIDSAGTGDWHLGELADPRMRQAAASRGYELTHRARQIKSGDFGQFDLILTMDEANFRNVCKLAPDGVMVEKVQRFTTYCTGMSFREVPDPYHGTAADFDLVLDILEDGCQSLLKTVTQQLGGR